MSSNGLPVNVVFKCDSLKKWGIHMFSNTEVSRDSRMLRSSIVFRPSHEFKCQIFANLTVIQFEGQPAEELLRQALNTIYRITVLNHFWFKYLGKILFFSYLHVFLPRCSPSYMGAAGERAGCSENSGAWPGGLHSEPQQERSWPSTGQFMQWTTEKTGPSPLRC